MANILLDSTIRDVISKKAEEYIYNKLVPRAKKIANEQIKNASSGRGKYSTGALVDSISADKISMQHYRIGTHGIKYAVFVDQGRSELPFAPTVNGKKIYTNYNNQNGRPLYVSKGPIPETTGAHIVDAWKSGLKGV